jgi:hypothetical protein
LNNNCNTNIGYQKMENYLMFGLQLAIIIVLIIIIFCYFKNENFSSGAVAHAYTAGATQRFASEFSSPAQGDRVTEYNMQIAAAQKLRSEKLTPTRPTLFNSKVAFDPSYQAMRNIAMQAKQQRENPTQIVDKELNSANKAFYGLR